MPDAERSLKIRLQMITDFAGAAQSATGALGEVSKGIEGVTTSAKGMGSLGGEFADLRSQIGSLGTAIDALTEKLAATKRGKKSVDETKTAVKDLGEASETASGQVDKVAASLDRVAGKAKVEEFVQAVNSLSGGARIASGSVDGLTNSLRTMLSVKADSVGRMFNSIAVSADGAAMAIRAVGEAMKALPPAKPYEGFYPPAIRPGSGMVPAGPIETVVGNPRGVVYLPSETSGPTIEGSTAAYRRLVNNALTGSNPYALPPGRSSNLSPIEESSGVLSKDRVLFGRNTGPSQTINADWYQNPYNQPPPPTYQAYPVNDRSREASGPTVAGSTSAIPRIALPPGQSTSLSPIDDSGGALSTNRVLFGRNTGPSQTINANWYQNPYNQPPPPIYQAQPVGGWGGGGAPPMPPRPGWWGGFNGGQASQNLYDLGDRTQSTGVAALVNGGMLAAGISPVLTGSMDVDDLLHLNKEAVMAAGGSESTAATMNMRARAIAIQTGADYRQTAGGLYNFVSALPDGVNIQDPGQQSAVMEGYKRAAMVSVSGGSSIHPLSMQETSLDMNNVITNLGLKTGNSKELGQAFTDASNILINFKNKTSTEVDLAASSIRAIGPIGVAMNQSPEDIVGMIAALAHGKVRGSQAGNFIKRWISREVLPTDRTAKLQKIVSEVSHGQDNLSLFDKQGKARSMLDVAGDVVSFENKYVKRGDDRAAINEQMSGLYANSGFDLLLDQIQKNGGVKGIRAMGHDIIHGSIAGGKTGDATKDSYAVRAESAKVQAGKASAQLQDEGWKVFKQVEPDLINVLHGVSDLVTWIDHLNPGVRKMGAEFLLGATAFSLVSGGALILVGNVLKVGGALGSVISKVGSIARIGSFASSIGGFVAALGPVGWTILGIIAAVALLKVAWMNDWGGIREKTAATVSYLEGAWKNIVGGVQWMVKGSQEWLGKYGHYIEGALAVVFPILAVFSPKFRAAGLDLLNALGSGIHAGLGFVGSALGKVGSAIATTVSQWVATAAHAGEAFIGGFTSGISQKLTGAKDAVKAGLQKVRDLFPSSEPKDASSPLRGMGQSGSTTADMYVHGLISGLLEGAGKVKKHKLKAAILDPLIDLKGQAVNQVEAMARAIEDSLTRHGAVIKKQWIDLVGPDGQTTRVSGSAQAYRIAVNDLKSHQDPILGEVNLYAKNVQKYKKSFEQEMSDLAHFASETTSKLTLATINAMEGRLVSQHQAAMDRVTARVKAFVEGSEGTSGKVGQGKTDVTNFDRDSEQFAATTQNYEQKLQNLQTLQKNSELPTLQELVKYLRNEQNERSALTRVLAEELSQRNSLSNAIAAANAQINTLNDSDAKQSELKQELRAKVSSLNDDLTHLDETMITQQGVIDGVNKKIEEYNQQIVKAQSGTDLWAKALERATQAGKQGSEKKLGDLLGSGASSFVDRILGLGGPKDNFLSKIIGAGSGDFVKTFTETILGGLIGGMAKDSAPQGASLGNIAAGALADADRSNALGSSTSNPLYAAIQNHSGDDIGSMLVSSLQNTDQNTSALGNLKLGADSSLMFSSAPVGGKDNLFDPYGSIGASKRGGVASQWLEASNGLVRSSQFSDADMSDLMNWAGSEGSSNGKTGLAALLQSRTGSTAGNIALGVGSIASGMQTGGLMGGVEAGLGTFESLSKLGVPPQVATPIAVGAGLVAMFSHHDDPAKMPDKFDTQRYGSIQANLLGAGYNGKADVGANGSTFTEDSSTLTATNNMGSIQYIQQWAQSNLANVNTATAAAAKLYQKQYGNYNAGATDANSIISYNKSNIGQESIVGGTLSGSYLDIANASNQAVQAIQQMTSASNASAVAQSQNAQALANSFTSMIYGGPSGFSMPYLSSSSGNSNMGSSMGGSMIDPQTNRRFVNEATATPGHVNLLDAISSKSSGSSSAPAPVNIHILEGATVSNSDDVVQAIRQNLPAITNAVAQANYKQDRYIVGNASALQ